MVESNLKILKTEFPDKRKYLTKKIGSSILKFEKS